MSIFKWAEVSDSARKSWMWKLVLCMDRPSWLGSDLEYE